uniref:Uncharacterized protein n=1 Tax=Anguilla anguilla TaxID=7936 RepID=A0A0E9UPZ6_ANGAN
MPILLLYYGVYSRLRGTGLATLCVSCERYCSRYAMMVLEATYLFMHVFVTLTTTTPC